MIRGKHGGDAHSFRKHRADRQDFQDFGAAGAKLSREKAGCVRLRRSVRGCEVGGGAWRSAVTSGHTEADGDKLVLDGEREQSQSPHPHWHGCGHGPGCGGDRCGMGVAWA